MQKKRFDLPNLGFGLGLRGQHYDYILEQRPAVDWFEIISENYMDSYGRPRDVLFELKEHYPFVMHGVSLSIGSPDPLDFSYLKRLKKLRNEINAHWVSDHLCWTGVAGKNMHDLLPLPYTEEVLKHVVQKIQQVQDYLEAPLLIENPSSYLEFTSSHFHEADFLRHMAEEADCALLLDVNNIFVSAYNHEFEALDYLDRIPHERVVQYHLAGHTNKKTHIIDTHSDHVIEEVWNIFKASYPRSHGAAVMVEWDSDIPDFEILHAEVLKAKSLVTQMGNEVQRA